MTGEQERCDCGKFLPRDRPFEELAESDDEIVYSTACICKSCGVLRMKNFSFGKEFSFGIGRFRFRFYLKPTIHKIAYLRRLFRVGMLNKSIIQEGSDGEQKLSKRS